MKVKTKTEQVVECKLDAFWKNAWATLVMRGYNVVEAAKLADDAVALAVERGIVE